MKVNNEFLETLGQYVYKYIDDECRVLYVGKGRGNRCLWHLEDKNYKIEHCYIVARNLEKFEDKKDWQSFLLESWLIASESPIDNSVSGHYKECFVMTSLSSMFEEFQAEQYDNFAKLPDWYVENYNDLRGKIRVIQITTGNSFFESSTRNSIKMMWYWAPYEEEVKVTFEVLAFANEDEKIENAKTKITQWLNKNGYDDVFPDGKKQKIATKVKDIDAVLDLFKKFTS
jgi:hypothetical protein